MRRSFIAFIALLFAVTISLAQATFTVSDMIDLRRVGDPQLSPDGRMVAYTIGVVDKAANRTLTQIFLVEVNGGRSRQITSNPQSSTSPRWSPDGRRIAFVTGGQIWTVEADGDNREQVTRLSTGASQPVWSPDGQWIAFTSEVYPQCTTDACNKAEDDKAAASKVQAHVTERLLFKHWNEWRDRKRTHVFVIPARGGNARDVTPGDHDSPPYGAASGVDYAFSPDSKGLVYLRNPDRIEAVSTNSDIYFINLTDNRVMHITAGMNGYDASPVFTPDGKYLLFRSQATPAFEADRWRIMRYNIQTREMVELTRGFDQQVSEMVVTRDSRTIYFNAGERGKEPIFSVPVEPDFRLRIATHVRKVVPDVYAGSINISPDGRTLVFAGSSLTAPNEIYRVNSDGTSLTALTTVNNSTLAPFRLQKGEDVEWMGALRQRIHGYIVKPANFDPAKKYPLLVLIHGGPQGAWSDTWSYRWNPQIYANQGYVVFMPNPRGSTGYGQKFVNDISGDWGGKAYTDTMNGVAEIIKRPYIDKNRIGAAGASYGGYMVNWILGHNNDPRFKFKTLVSHAGVYNLNSMATSTEELWFPLWEFKGYPWDNPLMYNRWSPDRFVKNFNTPTLVTAGELDFRVPYDQSLQLYTTLQVRGVPSKLIMFPDEGHWILKPQNSEFWYNNVLDWLKKYLNP